MKPRHFDPAAIMRDQRKSVFIFVMETKFSITSLDKH